MVHEESHEIRRASLSDSEEIARIHVASWSEPALPKPTLDQRLELWHHLLGGGPRRIQTWVAIDALGEIQGFAGAGRSRTLTGRFGGELAFLYVAGEHQRRGVGNALFLRVKVQFAEQRFSTAMTWVPERTPAIAFFLALGAIEQPDRRESRQGGILIPEALFAWTLS